MKPSAYIFILFINALILTACQHSAAKQRPAWIDDPGDGAVGFASTHVKGTYYQQELAIARARARLAARYGVDVSSVQTIRERVTNDRAYVSSDKHTVQQVRTTTVRAQVREIWHDKVRDEMWVWLYPVN